MKIPAANSGPPFIDQAQVAGPAGPKTSSTGLPVAPSKDEVSFSQAGAELAAAENNDATHERIAAFESRTQSRLELLAANGEGDAAQIDFSDVAQQFADHVARVQNGIDSGGLDAAGVARGLQNALGFLSDGVRSSLGIEDPSVQSAPAQFDTAQAPVAHENPGLTVEETPPAAFESAAPTIELDRDESRMRLTDLGRDVASRLSSLDLSGVSTGKTNPLASLQSNFEAVLGRLDHALEKGAIGQERLTSIVASAIDQLSAGLGTLFGSQESLTVAESSK
ncbi:MAG: hypothetical protein GY711_17895 [bacterium]|nr:hypothetical protein [bacterium]